MVLFVLSVGFYKFEVVNLDGMLLSRSSGMLTVGVLVAPLHTVPRYPGTLAYCTLVPLHTVHSPPWYTLHTAYYAVEV